MDASLSWLQAFASSYESATIPSADFCPITPCITAWSAPTNGGRKAGQISPGKNRQSFPAQLPHLPSPMFSGRASECCAPSPRGSAFYAISVRQLAGLHSGFFQTSGRPSALAFRSYFLKVSQRLLPGKCTGDLHPIKSCPCRAHTRPGMATSTTLRLRLHSVAAHAGWRSANNRMR